MIYTILNTPILTLNVICNSVKMAKKILKSRYYKYPSLQEIRELSDGIPTYGRLEFKATSIVPFALIEKHSLQEANKISALNNWGRVLSNKLFSLHETHLFLNTHYNRGFKENVSDNNQRELVDNILFRYFSETYYYFFFSTLDVMAHILNEYYDLNLLEKKVEFKDFLLRQVKNEDIRKKLLEFNSAIEGTREKRNSFTHRFPENEKDFRTKINIEKERTMLSCGIGNMTSNQEFIANITESSDLLKRLIDDLKLGLKYPAGN